LLNSLLALKDAISKLTGVSHSTDNYIGRNSLYSGHFFLNLILRNDLTKNKFDSFPIRLSRQFWIGVVEFELPNHRDVAVDS
jgi:hypothetical protein